MSEARVDVPSDDDAAWRARHRRAAAAFERAAAAVTDPAAPTPAGAWTAAEVIEHVRAGEDASDDHSTEQELIALQMRTLDLAVHSWDLAASQGIDPEIDDELCRALHERFAPFTRLMAQDDAFAPPLPVSDDATALERLIALCGRDPRLPLD